jgi:RNA polymerase sigma factor (TIGR02999 family)
LAALVWIVFGQTLQQKFVNFDDDAYVYQNPMVKGGLTPVAVAWAFTHKHQDNWHPLTSLSLKMHPEHGEGRPAGGNSTKAVPHWVALDDLTRMLTAIERGEPCAAENLLPLVYEELRRVAAARLAQERPGQTLQATALVHEAWLRVTSPGQPQWQGRRHFLGAAAEAMRRILVENARRKKRLRHGGELQRVDIAEVELASPMPDDKLLALDAALDKLAELNPRAAELVKLCFFTGLTQEQAAEQVGVSVATAERTWTFARAWLFREIKQDLNPAA